MFRPPLKTPKLKLALRVCNLTLKGVLTVLLKIKTNSDFDVNVHVFFKAFMIFFIVVPSTTTPVTPSPSVPGKNKTDAEIKITRINNTWQ